MSEKILSVTIDEAAALSDEHTHHIVVKPLDNGMFEARCQQDTGVRFNDTPLEDIKAATDHNPADAVATFAEEFPELFTLGSTVTIEVRKEEE